MVAQRQRPGIGVPGHEQHRQAGPLGADAVGQLAAGHPRHGDVGEQQVDRAGVRLGQRQSGGAVAGHEHVVTFALQDHLQKSADGVVILDEQDGPGRGRCIARCRRAGIVTGSRHGSVRTTSGESGS